MCSHTQTKKLHPCLNCVQLHLFSQFLYFLFDTFFVLLIANATVQRDTLAGHFHNAHQCGGFAMYSNFGGSCLGEYDVEVILGTSVSMRRTVSSRRVAPMRQMTGGLKRVATHRFGILAVGQTGGNNLPVARHNKATQTLQWGIADSKGDDLYRGMRCCVYVLRLGETNPKNILVWKGPKRILSCSD